MRIGLLYQGNRQWMGGLVYVQNLLKALHLYGELVEKKYTLVLIADGGLPPEQLREIGHLADEVVVLPSLFRTRILNKLKRMVSDYLPLVQDATLKRLGETARLDFLYPVHSLPGRAMPAGWAAWIPDFQHKYMPELFSRHEIANRDKAFQLAADTAPTLVLSSEVALQDFRSFIPRSTAQLRVLPFCTVLEKTWLMGDAREVSAQYGLRNDFFLVCNQFWKHKNHRVIVEAMQILKDSGQEVTVACTGALSDVRDPAYARGLIEDVKKAGLEGHFRTLGIIPRRDQIQLMRAASAVIQPSLFEGWSTVVEDARALQQRILLSDIPVHREQNPNHSQFFDPRNPEMLATLMSTASRTSHGKPMASDLEGSQSLMINREAAIQFASTFIRIAQPL